MLYKALGYGFFALFPWILAYRNGFGETFFLALIFSLFGLSALALDNWLVAMKKSLQNIESAVEEIKNAMKDRIV